MGACQSLPERIDRLAASYNMHRSVVDGGDFRHVLYAKPGESRSNRLHLYLEGDGRPWLKGLWPADDPTSARPLALELMARDPNRALLLGRPCYNGLHSDTGCDKKYWTSARYSAAVVNSMADALNDFVEAEDIREVTLIGYSGGGSLAILMAARVPNVTRIVTLAANLDTDAWAQRHGYLPLEGSLNPMTQARLDGIAHLHLVGADDNNVPPDMISAFAQRHGGSVKILPDYNHRCCWRKNWPQLLREALAITENPDTETRATAKTRPPGNRHEP